MKIQKRKPFSFLFIFLLFTTHCYADPYGSAVGDTLINSLFLYVTLFFSLMMMISLIVEQQRASHASGRKTLLRANVAIANFVISMFCAVTVYKFYKTNMASDTSFAKEKIKLLIVLRGLNIVNAVLVVKRYIEMNSH